MVAAPALPISAAEALHRPPMDEGKTASRAWTRQQTRLGQRAALPVVILGLLGTALAVAQAWCIAAVLSAGLGGQGRPLGPLVAFGALALVRAASWRGQRALRRAGRSARAAAAAQRRAVAPAAAGPALLRRSHSGELAAIVVDRIEALDGLFARWVPAAILAWSGPLVVLLAAALGGLGARRSCCDRRLLVPVAMAVAGIGAAAASRRQFLALARLQARFLDRVRGIATIVLAGRAEDEARCARPRRRRTARAHHARAAGGVPVLRRARLAPPPRPWWCSRSTTRARCGRGRHPVRTALFALLLVPEFFAPLRAFSAAYQDRLHATGAAEPLRDLPPRRRRRARAAVRTVQARGVSVAFEDVRLTWDAARGPALDGLSFRARRRRDAGPGRPVGRRQIHRASRSCSASSAPKPAG